MLLRQLELRHQQTNYRVHGLETEVVARVKHELTITGSASWNSSNCANAPLSKQPNGQTINIPVLPANPSVGGRQLGRTHQAHSYSATGDITAFDQSGFTTYEASLGAGKDACLAQFYIQNLTDTRANLFENGNQFITPHHQPSPHRRRQIQL